MKTAWTVHIPKNKNILRKSVQEDFQFTISRIIMLNILNILPNNLVSNCQYRYPNSSIIILNDSLLNLLITKLFTQTKVTMHSKCTKI